MLEVEVAGFVGDSRGACWLMRVITPPGIRRNSANAILGTEVGRLPNATRTSASRRLLTLVDGPRVANGIT